MSASNRLSAQESLEQAAINVWQFTAMKAPEQEVIRQLSYTLGTSDRKDQLRHLATAVRQLESEESAAREEQARYEKCTAAWGFYAERSSSFCSTEFISLQG